MSFFPSDWDDEDFDDSFDSLPGEIDALASDFESGMVRAPKLVR